MTQTVLEAPARVARRASAQSAPVVVVHVTTVPQTLNFLRGQMAALGGRGFAMHAVSAPGPALAAIARRDAVTTHDVPMERRITPFADLVSLWRLWRLFRRLRPSIVHGHTPKGGLLGMIAAVLAGVPGRVYTVHGLPLETARGLRRLLLRCTERISCALASRVHSVSPSLSRRVEQERLCPRRKMTVLGAGTVDGVDASRRFVPTPEVLRAGLDVRERLGIPADARVVGFVGRIVRDKGIVELAHAWKRLRGTAFLLIVGTRESEDPVPEPVLRALKSDPRVMFAGHVESMPSMYAAMDVVVLPSHREGFPQVPLEAAAMERPVVATRVTGCVDAVVDGVTGAIVEPHRPEELADAVARYIDDPELCRDHGLAARRRVLRDFRPGDRRDAVEAEYRRLLEGPPRAPRLMPRDRTLEQFLKRLVDVAGAIVGLLIALPLMAGIAVAVLATMRGPVLFRQRRPGLQGRPFTLLKFRTMRPGTEPDEVRVTPLGRFLRRSSLDELPQLWNVLVGEMSFVGPRPLLMEYLPLYSAREGRRHDVVPGITGWVQVNGRNRLTWDQKFDLDVWYVEHWSLLLDVTILVRTIAKVAGARDVDGPGNRSVPLFRGSGLQDVLARRDSP